MRCVSQDGWVQDVGTFYTKAGRGWEVEPPRSRMEDPGGHALEPVSTEGGPVLTHVSPSQPSS